MKKTAPEKVTPSQAQRLEVEKKVAHLERKIPFLERLDEVKRVEELNDGTKIDQRRYVQLIPQLKAELAELKAILV